jgi:hypothetical protein
LLLSALLLLVIIAAVLWGSGVIGTSPVTYDATVTGTVAVDGVPASRGRVNFFPADGGLPISATINPDGSYSVRAGSEDLTDPTGGTIASGEYTVTVFIKAATPANQVPSEGGPPRPGPSLIAAKYQSKATSGLQHTVKPGSNVIAIDLEGSEQDAGDKADPAGDEEKTDEAADEGAADGEAADENNAGHDNAEQDVADEGESS